ncbi:MAG: hypothetical protein QXF82_10730 [Nitrososphaeria archaeon]
MIISIKRILELNDKYHFVSGFSEQKDKPEGVGLDVRVGEIYKIGGRSFLGESGRITPATELIGSYKNGPFEVTIPPSGFVLVKTIEKVRIPPYKIKVRENGKPTFIMLDTYPRSTLQRCGIYLMATKTDPGYEGELVFGMANIGGQYFTIELGSRIANIVFKEVYGELFRPYEGRWKGGKVGTEGKKEKWR